MIRPADAAAIGPSDLGAGGLRRRVLEHVRTPLHRDGYALALNSAFTAASGLLYWILAAKTYSPHAVGLNSALISSMMFLAGLASLNLPNILVRFLPESGERTRRRAGLAYALSLTAAVAAAVIFILGVGSWAPRLAFLRSDHGLQAWFVFSTLAWCLFVLQDSVLIALGRAVFVPIENAVFSILKIVLLAVLATLAPIYGIFVSWTIAMLVSVIGVNLWLFARLLRPPGGFARHSVTTLRDRAFGGYFAADYACSVAWLSTTNLMPVIITAAAGATVNAYWALAYAVALPLYAFAQNIGTSLILHGTTDRPMLPSLTRQAARQGARILVPAVALLILAAPLILSLFGESYVHRSTTVLRLLLLGALPNFVLSLAVSVARVQRRLRRAVLALSAEAVLALGLATPMLHAFGIVGVGIVWVAAQSLVAAGLVLTWRRSYAPTPVETKPRQTVARGEAGRATADITPSSPSGAAAPDDVHPTLARLFERLEQMEVRWCLLRIPSRPAAPSGDVDVLLDPAHTRAFLVAAAEAGFVPLPGWEQAPDLILMRYDRPTGRWLVLDVSTEVSFREPVGWELRGAARQVLDRRRSDRSPAVPAPGDAFWLLLLHVLLDKEHVSEHHRVELRRLVEYATESPLGEGIAAAAGGDMAGEPFVRAVRQQSWGELVEFGGELRSAIARHRSVRERLRTSGVELRRAVRKPLLLRRRRGLSLALLGPNGVGKSTAAENLRRSFPLETRIVYMGLWKASSRPSGRVGAGAEVLTRPIRVWLRYLLAFYHQLRGRLVVYDRYVYEALLPPRPPLLFLKRPYFWLLSHAVPAAAIVVVLDVPGPVAFARKQENPPDELESERRIYAGMAARVPTLQLVDAEADAATVHAELSDIVWRRLAGRWGR